MVRACASWRFGHVKIPNHMFLCDMRIVFCWEHQHLDELVRNNSGKTDIKLVLQYHERAHLVIDVCDVTRAGREPAYRQVMVKVGNGAPPGGPISSELFMGGVYPAVDDWLLRGESHEALWVFVPLEVGSLIDASFTAFADDLARMVLASSCGELHRVVALASARLDECLQDPGVVQNRSEKR
jgi:hypothetical protein